MPANPSPRSNTARKIGKIGSGPHLMYCSAMATYGTFTGPTSMLPVYVGQDECARLASLCAQFREVRAPFLRAALGRVLRRIEAEGLPSDFRRFLGSVNPGMASQARFIQLSVPYGFRVALERVADAHQVTVTALLRAGLEDLLADFDRVQAEADATGRRARLLPDVKAETKCRRTVGRRATAARSWSAKMTA